MTKSVQNAASLCNMNISSKSIFEKYLAQNQILQDTT